MTDFTDEEVPEKTEPIYLGIIGSRNDISNQNIIYNIMNPILQELKRPPEKVILPSEGSSSIFISDWADSLHIPCQIYEADWHRHQRRAKIFRDSRIQKESTHFIVFLNKRSEFNEKLAIRLAKQNHTVFTISWKNCEIEELLIEKPPSLQLPLPLPEVHESKRGTGKGSRRKEERPLLDHKSHNPLLKLWASSYQKS
jgi:hypothetical protein